MFRERMAKVVETRSVIIVHPTITATTRLIAVMVVPVPRSEPVRRTTMLRNVMRVAWQHAYAYRSSSFLVSLRPMTESMVSTAARLDEGSALA